jgi:glutathione S-transferase
MDVRSYPPESYQYASRPPITSDGYFPYQFGSRSIPAESFVPYPYGTRVGSQPPETSTYYKDSYVAPATVQPTPIRAIPETAAYYPDSYPINSQPAPSRELVPAPQSGDAPLPKLYIHQLSTNCMGPWMLLRESGIPFDLIEVDFLRGDTHTPEFLSMNPMGKVPTYVESDGSVIWESNAIMRYICERHAVPEHYYPRDVNLRGRIEMALDWRQTVLYPNLTKVTYPYLQFSKDRSKITEGKAALDKDLKVLTDFFLRETPFIGGAMPCIADYAIGLPLLYLYATDYRNPAKVREYLENLAGKTPCWNEITDALKDYMSTQLR